MQNVLARQDRRPRLTNSSIFAAIGLTAALAISALIPPAWYTATSDKHEAAAEYAARAETLIDTDQADKAFADMDAAIRLSPHELKYVTEKAFWLLGMNRFDEATDVMNKAVQQFPNDKNIANGLAFIKARREYVGRVPFK